jgi:hypothetical protein
MTRTPRPAPAHRWDVFDPADGTPVLTVRWRWLAHHAARRMGLDYAPAGRHYNGQPWTPERAA